MTDERRSPAQAYSDYFGPAIFEPLSRQVIELAAPEPGERVLDVACGTGIVTRLAAERVGAGGRVVGVDLNPAMIDVARSLHVPEDGPVEWHQGDGAALPVPDAAFDLVLCQQGLQFFPDRAAGAAEMRRVLVDTGRAVIAVWHGLEAHPLYAALADAEQPHLSALGVAVSRDELAAPFSFGDADALRDVLTGAGFGRVEVETRAIEARFADADHFVERMENAYAAVVPRFATDAAAFHAYLEAIAQETRTVVDGYREDDEVVVPMHANVAVAYA